MGEINLREEASVIADQLYQAYENYGHEYDDDDLYAVADEHINEWLEPTDVDIWNRAKDFIQTNYSVADIYVMSPEQFEGILRTALR